MPKQIITNLQGQVELLGLDEGGTYFDSSSILWDERSGQPCPQTLLDQAAATAHTLLENQAWQMLRKRRDALLSACDWTQVTDTPSTVNKPAWATYRQQLRDLPDQPGIDPTNPIWPVPPS